METILGTVAFHSKSEQVVGTWLRLCHDALTHDANSMLEVHVLPMRLTASVSTASCCGGSCRCCARLEVDHVLCQPLQVLCMRRQRCLAGLPVHLQMIASTVCCISPTDGGVRPIMTWGMYSFMRRLLLSKRITFSRLLAGS